MTQTTAACGPLGSLVDLAKAKPILLLPAIIAAFTCGHVFVGYVPTKADCDADADKVAVSQDGWAHWVGKEGDVTFGVANKPLPKHVCVIELDKDKATAFVADRSFTWDVWRKEHQG
jgi:hypothetical protein